jgi:hypothetical protein
MPLNLIGFKASIIRRPARGGEESAGRANALLSAGRQSAATSNVTKDEEFIIFYSSLSHHLLSRIFLSLTVASNKAFPSNKPK